MKNKVPNFNEFINENKIEKAFGHIKEFFNSAQTKSELEKLKDEADNNVKNEVDGWNKDAVEYFYSFRKRMLGPETNTKTASDIRQEDGRYFYNHSHRKQYRKTW